MRRLEREQWGNAFLYLDKQADRLYRQVAGGLAWPQGAKAGFLIVVGEESRPELESGQRVLWVLAEQEAASLADIYRHYRELSEKYLLREWYGDPGNRAMMQLFRQQGREVQGEKLLPLVVLGAPYHDDPQGLTFYVQTVNELVKSSKKLLFFGEHSKLPGNFLNLTPEDFQGKATDYPAIAALGYAVTALRVYAPAPAVAPEYQERETWSPYGPQRTETA